MTNLRIISDNAADRATLTASSTAGTLAVANLKTDAKSVPWRSVGTTARIGAVWTTSELIGAMFLPFCNLSPTATLRVRATNEGAIVNTVKSSENFANAARWVPTRSSIISSHLDSPVAPDGVQSMGKLVTDTSPDTSHYTKQSSIGSFVVGDQMTYSLFVAPAEMSQVYLQLSTTGGALLASKGANFDLVTGAISLKSSGITAGVVPYVGGIWRCWITVTADGVGSAAAIAYLASATGSNTGRTTLADGDGVSGIYIWGASVTKGALSSYYPSAEVFTSRASTATYVDAAGLLQTAAINAARTDYNPITHVSRGLLLEPAATNLALQSSQFDNAIWTKIGLGSVVANAVAAPDGTTTADRLQEDAGLTAHSVAQTIAVVSGTTYTVSVFAKAGERSVLGINLGDGAFGSSSNVCFDLVAGVCATAGAGIVSIQPYPGGWWRCSWTIAAIADANSGPTFHIVPAYSSVVSTWTYTGDGASGLYLWGVQMGVSPLNGLPSSYIPTTTVAVTRAADVYASSQRTKPAAYIDTWQSYDYDSGTVLACPAAAVSLRGFTAAQAASAYAYGGGACARAWLPAQMQALGMAIDIVDTANLQGYIEAARLVVGAYWSPANNADYGASMTVQDASKHYRTDGGDLLTDVGTRARKMPLQLSAMPPADRTALLNIMRSNGMAGPMLISLFPGDADLELERDHTIYGKLSSISAMAIPYFSRYSMPLEIEEI